VIAAECTGTRFIQLKCRVKQGCGYPVDGLLSGNYKTIRGEAEAGNTRHTQLVAIVFHVIRIFVILNNKKWKEIILPVVYKYLENILKPG
jgi:hypothetical protein